MSTRKELIGALGALLRRLNQIDRVADLRGGTLLRTAQKVYASAVADSERALPWSRLRRASHGPVTASQIASVAQAGGVSMAEAQAMFDRLLAEETLWVNDVYQVAVRDTGDGGRHLSIKRIDQEPVHDWRDLQRIKNELLGPDCEAVELYPAESRRVDTANQYHLWGTIDPAFRFGFGFEQRLVSSGSGSHHQRAMADAERET